MRNKIRKSHGRTWAIVSTAAAIVIVLACFTSDAVAEKSKGKSNLRNLSVASMIYSSERLFGPQIPYGSTEPVQLASYLGSPVPAAMVDLDVQPPVDANQWINLPSPGSPHIDQTVLQHVVARLEFGPGSEPFAIDSFFDITYRIANAGPSEFGPYQVELLAMSLTGIHPTFGAVEIRESPTLASMGQHTITPLPGTTLIELLSFFDVFTEISIGGGPFVAADEEFRVGYVPEPTSIALAIVGIMGCGIVLRRKKGQR